MCDFQLFVKELCMDFSDFHCAMEVCLERPLFTHEFIDFDRLVKDYLGETQQPSFEEIVNLIPEAKILVVMEVESNET